MWRRGVFGGSISHAEGGLRSSNSSAEISRLVSRMKVAELASARADSVRCLANIARGSPADQRGVFDQGCVVFLAILDQDRDDVDALLATLELVRLCCSPYEVPQRSDPHSAGGDREQLSRESANVAAENCAQLLSTKDAIEMLLTVLQIDDFHVQVALVSILSILVQTKLNLVRERVLDTPSSLTILIDVLRDSRPIIRNELLLVLIALSEESEEISKILAFDNIFDTVFQFLEAFWKELASEDEDTDESSTFISARDCLLLINNVLRCSSSIRTIFMEGGHLDGVEKGLKSLLDRPLSSSERIDYAKNILDIIVNLTQTQENALKWQRMCGERGFLVYLLRICTRDVSSTVITRALAATYTLLCNNSDNRNALLGILPPTLAQRPLTFLFRLCCCDPSASVRLAAYEVIQESLRNEYGHSNDILLEVMSNSQEWSSASDQAVAAVVELIRAVKDSILLWPDQADDGAVFYGASLLSWVLLDSSTPRLARSRMLGFRYKEDTDFFFPRCFRALSFMERENSPPAAQIGLLKLLATWLNGSPDAIASFLSSAMHLPLIIEIITKNTGRHNSSEIHVKGLAAQIIAICLENEGDDPNISKDTLMDIIRNRIGISLFTSYFDELRASDSFVAALTDTIYTRRSVSELEAAARKSTILRSGDKVGHVMWYDHGFAILFNDLYIRLHRRVVEFVASPSNPASVASTHWEDNFGEPNASAVEVAGYKELIRNQDSSISQLKKQEAELQAALRETRQELEILTQSANKRSSELSSHVHEEMRELREEASLSAERVQTLQTLLEQKTQDAEALAHMCSELEADLARQTSRSGESSITLERDEAIRALDQSVGKVRRLEQMLNEMSRAEEDAEAELQALRHENDNLRSLAMTGESSSGGQHLAEMASLKRRAEIAEASLSNRTSLIEELESELRTLNDAVDNWKEKEREASTASRSSEDRVRLLETELHAIRIDHDKEVAELKKSIEISDASYKVEIKQLRAELEARAASDTSLQLEELRSELHNHEKVLEAKEREIIDLRELEKSRGSKFSLMESRVAELTSSLKESRTTTEQLRKEYDCERVENKRLSSLVRELQATAAAAADSATSHTSALDAYERNLLEVKSALEEKEQLMNEADAMILSLRDELTSRADQALHLSERLNQAEAQLEDSRCMIDQLESELESVRLAKEAYEEETGNKVTGEENQKSLEEELKSALQECHASRESYRRSLQKIDVMEALQFETEKRLEDLNLRLLESEDRERNLRGTLDDVESKKLELEKERRTLLDKIALLDARAGKEAAAADLLDSRDRRIHVLEADMRGISYELSAAVDRGESLQIELAMVTKERDQRISQLETEKENLRQAFQCSTEEGEALRYQLEGSWNQLKAANDALLDAETRLEKFQSELNDIMVLKHELESEQAQNTGLIAQLELLRDEYDKITGEKISLQQSLCEKSSQLKEVEDKVLTLEDLMRSRAESIIELETVRSELEGQLQVLVDGKEKMTGELKEVTSLADQATGRVKEVEAQLEELQGKLTGKVNAMTALQLELDAKLDDFKVQLLGSEERERNLRETLQSTQYKNLSLEEENGDLREKVNTISEREAASSDVLNNLKQKILGLEATRADLEQQLLDVEKQRVELKIGFEESLRKLEGRIVLLETEKENLKWEASQVVEQRELVRIEIENVNNKAREFEQNYSKAELRSVELRKELDVLIGKRREMELEVAQKSDMMKQLALVEEELKVALIEKSQLKATVDKTIDQLREITERNDTSSELIRVQEVTIADLEREKKGLEETLREKERQLECLTRNLNEAREHEMQIRHLMSQVALLQDNLQESANEKTELKASLENVAKHLAEARDFEVTLRELLTSKDETISELESVREEIQRRLNMAVEQNELFLGQFEDARKQEAHMKDLMTQVSLFEEERHVAISEKIQLSARLEEMTDELKDALEKQVSLSEGLKAKDEVISALGGAKMKLEQNLMEAVEHKEKITHELRVTSMSYQDAIQRVREVEIHRESLVVELEALKVERSEVSNLQSHVLELEGQQEFFHRELSLATRNRVSLEARLEQTSGPNVDLPLTPSRRLNGMSTEGNGEGDLVLAEEPALSGSTSGLDHEYDVFDESHSIEHDIYADEVGRYLKSDERKLAEPLRVYPAQILSSLAEASGNASRLLRVIDQCFNSMVQAKERAEQERDALQQEIDALYISLVPGEGEEPFEGQNSGEEHTIEESPTQAYLKLRQEHSELLVCLAEMELEYNSLKEQLESIVGPTP